MTNKKTTRRALFSSVMALLLCCSMLVGTTFAWFTDSVTSAGNIIKSGTLDVAMYYGDNKDSVTNDASTGTIFNYSLWEPGFTQTKYVKIVNKGTLAFQYQLNVIPEVKPADGQVDLANVIDVYCAIVNDSFTPPTRDTFGTMTKLGTLKELMANPKGVDDGKLLPAAATVDMVAEVTGEKYVGEVTVCIALHMQETAGNEYQNLSVGDGFCVQLLATQLAAEIDSFGSEYDTESEYPISGAGSATADGTTDVTVRVYDVNTGDTVAVLSVPGERTVAETNVSAHVEEEPSVDEAVWAVATQGGEAKTFDIHVDGLTDGTEPVKVELFVGKGLKDPKVYHGAGDPVAYTELSATYNASTGFITFETTGFSPFAVVYEKAEVNTAVAAWDGTSDTTWYNETDTEFVLTSAEALAGLAVLVDEGNAFEGKTIKLDVDMDLYCEDESGEPLSFDPIGSYRNDQAFKGTFDGQGHTISNMSQNTWALNNGYYYGDLGLGLFGLVEDATVKELVMDGASISGESAIVGIVAATAYGDCTFENIKVTNSQGADYQYYAGGIVGWASGNHQYINCDVDATTTIAGQWGDFDNSNGGVVGGAGGSAKIFMKDCDVACRIDAYNDVTSTYQWYAYRRSGMLIGNTGKTEVVDGTTYAAAPQLTCENVTVTYGDWANYTYCEFAGTSWPYVRVQAGVSNSAYSNPRYGHPTDANGNEVIDDNHVHNEGEDHFILCAFDQLYGGGQGVYGTASHDGVTVIYNNK